MGLSKPPQAKRNIRSTIQRKHSEKRGAASPKRLGSPTKWHEDRSKNKRKKGNACKEKLIFGGTQNRNKRKRQRSMKEDLYQKPDKRGTNPPLIVYKQKLKKTPKNSRYAGRRKSDESFSTATS